MDQYVLEPKAIGQGSFGIVYRARHKATGELVAVKQVKIDIFKEGIPGTVMREISNMQELNHKNIVKLKETVFADSGTIFLVMEHLDMNFHAYLELTRKNNNGRPLPEPLIQRFTRQLIKGIDFCHAHQIIHRDLKPANLLLDSKQRLKIADFGMSRMHSLPAQKFMNEVSTLWYRPPEVLLGELEYTGSYDMWSAGCIIAHMARGNQPLFSAKSDMAQLDAIFKVLGTPNETIWPGVSNYPRWKLFKFPEWETQNLVELLPGISGWGLDFVVQCFFYPPQLRLSACRALMHPWISKST